MEFKALCGEMGDNYFAYFNSLSFCLKPIQLIASLSLSHFVTHSQVSPAQFPRV